MDVLTCLPNYPQGQIFEGYRGRLSKRKINACPRILFKRAVSMMSFATMLWLFCF